MSLDIRKVITLGTVQVAVLLNKSLGIEKCNGIMLKHCSLTCYINIMFVLLRHKTENTGFSLFQ